MSPARVPLLCQTSAVSGARKARSKRTCVLLSFCSSAETQNHTCRERERAMRNFAGREERRGLLITLLSYELMFLLVCENVNA